MLKIKNLTKSYHHKTALDKLTITLEEGKIYGLIGNNGAGKTTLFNLIASQIQFDEGTILFEDHPISEKDLAHIAYFLDHSIFDGKESVKSIIKKFIYFFDDFDPSKASQIIISLGLNEDEKLGQMSTGERKKCELALMLARNAKLYLLDEPFANMDPLVRSELMAMIVRFSHEHATYVISTHQVQEVESYIDETVLLKDGKLILQGNNDDLRNMYQCSIAELLIQKLKEV